MSKRIILAGGSGFLGGVLARYLRRAGYDIVVLTRSPKQVAGEIRQICWDGRTLNEWAREFERAARILAADQR